MALSDQEKGTSPVQDREFPFLIYFLAVSLVVIGGMTTLITYLSVVEVRREFIENAAEYALEIVENLFHQVEVEFLQPRIERGEAIDIDPRDPRQLDELSKVVERSTYKHHVQRLYFFNTDGLIIFSTERAHIGFVVPPGNRNFQAALGGSVSWAFKGRRDPLDLTGSPADNELLETYVPVRSRLGGDPDRVAGVIEIYQNMENLEVNIEKTRGRLVSTALGSLGALFAVFTGFIVYADRAIRRRRQELIRSNAALRDLSENLEGLVARRTQELIEKEKLASLGVLAAGVAHEINNPLGTIAACAEGSIKRLESDDRENAEDRERLRRYLELIGAEAFRCKEITRNLLEYSRQSPVQVRENLDLDSLVRDTLELVRLGKEKLDPRIELDLRSGSRPVRADAGQLRQVVRNLLENALHSLRDCPGGRVALRTRVDGDRVVFECEDNGSGIPAEDRKKIFEPFFTTKAAGEGVGLGLALSLSIIQRHGGQLDLAWTKTREEAAGVPSGSLFRFSLPLGGNRETPGGAQAASQKP